MTQISFYPLGNADTSLIQLRDGRRILIDYANKWSGTAEDKRCDLPKLLKEDLKAGSVSDYSVVAFTHLDDDHCQGASEYFYFEYKNTLQGLGRPKMNTLWVPASALTEQNLSGDAWVIRQEARHRLREGKGIVVFSRPERLKQWFADEQIKMEDRLHCFVDAGQTISDFTLLKDYVEFFVHSPHAMRTDERGVEDRNGDSIVFQARFEEGGSQTDVLFTGDVDHTVLDEIIRITRWYGNDDRLHWNVYHLPHHCSYKALGALKGDDKTVPIPNVRWLCETQGEALGYIVSPSKPIPHKGTPEDDDVQPPHRQAANYYRSEVLQQPNRLLVTMSEPTTFAPKPIVLIINGDGASKNPVGSGGSAAAASVIAPRAG